ncbi:MAG: hypothetical protein AAF389_07695 [Gemmatimonadota bacterium]
MIHRRLALAVLVTLSVHGDSLQAQTPTMPSTVRYGSGLIDIPVSSVLPHLQVTATLSGFFSQLGRRVQLDDAGNPSGFGPGRDDFLADGAFAIGLFDRAEAGISLQSFGGDEQGGAMWGLFGRVRLWEPIDQGLGLAVGARYLTGPSFGDGVEYAPGRLGFPDERLRTRYTGGGGIDTDFSPYVVATAYLRGWDGGRLPPNDMTFTFGYGGGMFSEGASLDFYSDGHANGWFMGAALHVDTSPSSQLTVMAEHNGFDVNVGAHYDWEGIRVGAQYLAGNHSWPEDGHIGEYQKPKWGILASFSICPGSPGLRCRPRGMARVEPDTIYIPPPPPDTVVVRVGEAPRLEGQPTTLCLSTGRNVEVHVTAAGDTLVGPMGTPLRQLRPVVDFAGAYAGSAFWYQNGEPMTFEGQTYQRSDEVFPIDCDQLLRVGRYEGVPVFAVLSASRPFSMLFVPVTPGLWIRYERGFEP